MNLEAPVTYGRSRFFNIWFRTVCINTKTLREASLLILLLAFTVTMVSAQSAEQKLSGQEIREASADSASHQYYKIETRLGALVIRLSNKTPRHRDNFQKLVRKKFYDGITFHRIIQGYMIQGGDPWTLDDDPMNDGFGGASYTIPAEFDTTLFHTYGAVSAARQNDQVNPLRESNGSQFFIIHGRPVDPRYVKQREAIIAQRYPGFQYPDSVKSAYTYRGGAPQLDLDYTVFGQVVEGFEVLEAIARTETPRKMGEQGPLMDRALTPIPMTVVELTDYSPPVR